VVGGDELGVVAGDEGGLSGGAEDGPDIITFTLKLNLPIPGRCIAVASRWHAAELEFGGHLRRPTSLICPSVSEPSGSIDPFVDPIPT
jgi:hypothetical protein